MSQNKKNIVRILVADDEEAILQVYRDVLGKGSASEGATNEMKDLEEQLFGVSDVSGDDTGVVEYDLTFCRSGEEAVEAVREAVAGRQPYAIAFLDVRMPPGKDGVWAAEQIRQIDAETQLVMVTGYSDVNPSAIMSRVPPPDRLLYVQKPFHAFEIAQFASTLAARWQVEGALQELNRELNTRVRQRTADLEKANLDLKVEIKERIEAEKQHEELRERLEKAERMESIGILAGGVAHDLNNILGPLVAYPELILAKLPQESQHRRKIEMMGKSAKDAAEVIQNLLTLARRGRYEMEPVDLGTVLDHYLNSIGFQALADGNRAVKVHIDVRPDVESIEGSPAHLTQVIMNLVVNAYDAMPTGGDLEIGLSQQNVTALPSGHIELVPGEYLLIRVKDSGMGIPEQYLDRIFEPYFSQKPIGRSGSGLGLAVVYGIVKDHKGYYDIVSAVGEGTDFTCYFPVSKAVTVPSVVEDADNTGEERILVVDDDESQRVVAIDILSGLGYKVVSVAGGRAAVEYLSQHEVDLVTLDMIMEEDFDGLDAYREILKNKPGQRAIILTGFALTSRVTEMQALGAGVYLRKPYSADTLAAAVRGELDRRPEQGVRQ